MSEASELEVYIKPGCPWCVESVAWLREKGYRFQIHDVIAEPGRFREMQALSGQSKVPTLTCGELLLADFGVDELIPFLREHGIEP